MAKLSDRLKGEKQQNHERWLLPYADMITLLMAFFVVMFALSTQDLRKFAMLSKSMEKAFNLGQLRSYINPIDLGGAGSSLEPGFVEMSQIFAFEHIRTQLGEFAEKEGVEEMIGVKETKEGIAITLSGDLLFPSGKAQLKPQSLNVLQKVAEIVRPLSNPVRIEGHTDNIPCSNPDYPTNWDLSTIRATAVLRYLIDFGNIPAERLSAVGFGKYKPIVANDTSRNRAKNRRAEVLIVYPPKEEKFGEIQELVEKAKILPPEDAIEVFSNVDSTLNP